MRLLLVTAFILAMLASALGLSTKKMQVIDSNYNVALGFTGLGVASCFTGNLLVGLPSAALGALLFKQTGRVRFVFDSEAMEVKVNKGNEELTNSGENFAVGGRNRWSYKTFTRWGMVPSKEFPVFMYFYETQTDKDKEQFHLFPVIMDGKMLYNAMVEKVGIK
jgi:hypothetical protein